MLKLLTTRRFDKDVKLNVKRGKDLTKLHSIIESLQRRERLPPQFHDHSLSGIWSGHRECHIESDLLLVYRVENVNLILIRIGTHSDIFG